jgi:hypothetical protein
MVEIIVATIGGIALVGAAYITANMATKLKGAEGRTEATNDELWRIIEGLRADLANIRSERDRIATANDKLLIENDALKAKGR